MKKATALFYNAAIIILLGCMCIVSGLVMRSIIIDCSRMFQSGHWSVQAVKENTEIKTENDFATEKERKLFIAFQLTNQQCINLTAASSETADILIVIGLGLLILGGMSAWLAIRLRKEIAEQAASGNLTTLGARP